MADTGSLKVAIIGAGPGGYAAAFMAADLGLEVTLIDKETTLGGACLLRGCIPSKALLHAAEVIGLTQEAKVFGLDFASPKIELARLREWKEEVVKKLAQGLTQMCQSRTIKFIQGTAAFLDSNAISIKAGEKEMNRLDFDYAILATGSHPIMLPFLPASKRIMSSDAALDLAYIPKTMLVIGGGYIGLELGTVYHRLGCKISIIEKTFDLLPSVDKDLSGKVRARAMSHFESILLESQVTAVTEKVDALEVAIKDRDGKEIKKEYEAILVAVGRKPASSGLGLENTKVTIDKSGFIQIDPSRRTSDPAIYCVGDVGAGPMLAHKASHEGKVAAQSIAGRRVAFEPRAIPAVVFTDPEVAWCGVTEDEAKEKGLEVTVSKFPWSASGRALTLHRTDGLTKLIIDRQSQRIIGVGLAGQGCGELISEGVLAIEMGCRAEDLALSIHPHPTLSETLMESAQFFLGTSASLYKPRRIEGKE